MTRALLFLLYGGLAACAVAITVVRFSHPALTETQLFLVYWPLSLGALACAILGGLALYWADRRARR